MALILLSAPIPIRQPRPLAIDLLFGLLVADKESLEEFVGRKAAIIEVAYRGYLAFLPALPCGVFLLKCFPILLRGRFSTTAKALHVISIPQQSVIWRPQSCRVS